MPKEALAIISILKNTVGKNTVCEPIDNKPVTHEYRVGIEGIELIYKEFDTKLNRWNPEPNAIINSFGDSPVFCDERDAIGYADIISSEMPFDGIATFDIIHDFQDRTFEEITK